MTFTFQMDPSVLHMNHHCYHFDTDMRFEERDRQTQISGRALIISMSGCLVTQFPRCVQRFFFFSEAD